MKEYVYPDIEDQITSRLVEKHGSDNWELQEKWVLEEALIKICSKETTKMMDLGCGMGRLTDFFGRLFKHIICIDPDPDRLAMAKKHLVIKRDKSIEFVQGFAPKIEIPQEVDFILCSHVIQHIPTYQLPSFFSWLSNHLKLSGLILILFAKSTTGRSEFSVGFAKGGGMRLTEEEFNDIFNKEGNLPVHMIPPLKVEEIARDFNLEVDWECAFHLRSKIKLSEIESILRFIEQTKISREIGIDHAMILSKVK